MTVFSDYMDRVIPLLEPQDQPTTELREVGYGIDIDAQLTDSLLDVYPDWRTVDPQSTRGIAVTAIRALWTVRGSILRWADRGYYLPGLLHQGMTPTELRAAESLVGAEVRKDARVQTCVAALTLSPAGRLSVRLTITPLDRSTKFELIFSVGTDGSLMDLVSTT